MREPPMAGVTLEKLQTYYTLDDLADMHEAMDIQDEYARRAEAKRKSDAAARKR